MGWIFSFRDLLVEGFFSPKPGAGKKGKGIDRKGKLL